MAAARSAARSKLCAFYLYHHPCGHLADPSGAGGCTPSQRARYRARVSGPLLDRIGLHVEMPPLSGGELAAAGQAEPTADVRARVARARPVQSARAAAVGLTDAVNATTPAAAARACCVLGPESRALLRQAVDRLGLSPRAYHRLGRVARTIADLEGVASVGAPHVAEAIGYRTLDRAMQSGAAAPF